MTNRHGQSYTPAEYQFIDDNKGKLSDAQIAHVLGRTAKAVKEVRLQMARDEAAKLNDELAGMASDFEESLQFPISLVPDSSNQQIIEADSFAVVSDLHAPHQDASFLQKIVATSEAWKIPVCIVNGDLFDHSRFKNFPGRQYDPSYEQELAAVEQIVHVLSNSFEEVWIDTGNHENRYLLRLMNSALSVERWQRLWTHAPNVRVVNYPEIFVHGESKWVTAHPDIYSKIPAKTALEIQKEKYPDHHVIAAHDHHVGMMLRRTSVGIYYCISSGCCSLPNTFEYVTRSSNAMPNMNEGAVIVKENHPHFVTPASPWDALERMYRRAA